MRQQFRHIEDTVASVVALFVWAAVGFAGVARPGAHARARPLGLRRCASLPRRYHEAEWIDACVTEWPEGQRVQVSEG